MSSLVHRSFSRSVGKYPCCWMWPIFFLSLIIAIVPIMSGAVKVDPSSFSGFDTEIIPEQVEMNAYIRGLLKDENLYPHAVAKSDNDDDMESYVPMITSILYTGLVNDEVFTAGGINAMAEVEGQILSDPLYAPNCRTARNSLNSSLTNCSSPTTVLSYLFRNDALHESQCLQGWCSALAMGWSLDSLATECTSNGHAFGKWPCISTIFDWRDGALADEASWPALMYDRLCNLPAPGDAYSQSMMQLMLPHTEMTCTESSLSARYARAMYNMQTGFNETILQFFEDHEDATGEFVDSVDAAVDRVSATKAADSVTTTKATGGKTVNVFYSAYWTDPNNRRFFRYLFGDMALSGISLLLVVVILLLNTQSILLMLAGIFEILLSVPLAMFTWMIIGQKTVSTMELLGLFLILCVGADDIFVFTDTWTESQYMPPAISGSLTTRFAWTYRRAASAMLTTTATTCITLVLNAASPFRLIKSFGIFNMFVVMWDYILVITWYATTVVGVAYLAEKCCAPGKNWEFSCCCRGPSGDAAPMERRSTAFMRTKVAPILGKGKWPLLIVTTAMLGGGIAILATNFQEGEQQFLPDAHPVTQMGNIQSDHFGVTEDEKYSNVLMYGLDTGKPVSYPQGHDFFINMADDYEDSFKAQYDDSFTFGPAQQQQIVDDCDAFGVDADLVPAGETYCVLNELQAHAPAAFPYATESALRAALVAFYASSHYAQLKANFTDYEDYTGFVDDPDGDGINAVWHSFNSTFPMNDGPRPPAGKIRPYYNDWVEAVEARCVDAPCVMTNREGLFSSMATTTELRITAIVNMITALAVSYVVLVITTSNLIVPLLALLSIGSTIVWALGCVFLAGYEFNGNAAILSVMAVGLAVDYAVHLTHFYNEASGTRYEKTQDALHGVGISIIGGAVTTGGAAVPLLFVKNFVFFQMAGYFIFFTAFWGVLFTFFQLTPVLMLLGPEGDTGDVRALFRKCFGGKANDGKGLEMKNVASTTAEVPDVQAVPAADAAKPTYYA